MAKNPNYQTLTKELEQIVEKLQSENTAIEEALKLYERGTKIAIDIAKYLDQAENSLKRISPKP